ncbi:MAG TPA: hypothetical protein DCQ30_12185 [Acidimicrobiaceae bacterium]|nr:hypothetical protein [Acidimicrobiaceae bacterium]
MTDEIISALEASEMFRDLPAKRLKQIRDAGREMTFAAGSALVDEGDEAGRFFLILDGSAEVTAHGEKRATLGPGGAVGELALIDGGPRSATVTAVSDLRAFSLASWNFKPFLDEPDVLHAIVAMLCRRLRGTETAAQG